MRERRRVSGMQRLVCPRALMAFPDEPRKPLWAADPCSSDADSEVLDVGHDDDEDAMDLSRRGLSDEDEDARTSPPPPPQQQLCNKPPPNASSAASSRLAFSVENILDPTKFTGRALCWKPLGHPDDDLSSSDLGKDGGSGDEDGTREGGSDDESADEATHKFGSRKKCKSGGSCGSTDGGGGGGGGGAPSLWGAGAGSRVGRGRRSRTSSWWRSRTNSRRRATCPCASGSTWRCP
ncbi:Hypothetical predicted protein [Cloeon dipterum]|uniref:Uncharacterized protein n=1 Tax=Cloeon dipterum TaxID=197152 RepID=A0A8S1DLI8_9INSE|nr:Hypothetical predicted protein [Cloeon dipterum]